MQLPFYPEYYSLKKAGCKAERDFQTIFKKIGEVMYEARRVGAINGEGSIPRDFFNAALQKVYDNLPNDQQRKFLRATLSGDDSSMFFTSFFCEEYDRKPDKKIYRISDKFLKALSRMDVDTREELLPNEEFLSYIAFQEPMQAVFGSEHENYYGTYVRVAPWTGPDSEVMQGVTITLAPAGMPMKTEHMEGFSFGVVDYMTITVKFGEKIAASVDAVIQKSIDHPDKVNTIGPAIDPEQAAKATPFIRTMLNVVMYLHSLNPDVSHLKPATQQTARERKEVQAQGLDLNNSSFPVICVSWGYGKDREYSVDSTLVRTHLRWQPCGPGRGQTKLIMVKEHERHYKKGAATEFHDSCSPPPCTE